VGVSGAGKSTVSLLSSAQGDKVIHDDHIVVYREDEKWSVTNTSHSIRGTPIKAILFLFQDKEDKLIPINTARTAMGLIKSLEEHGRHVLFGDVFRSAFSTCSEIARHVPGYELHFRKSADFWKLIDEQFPD
jgi:ABC-type dipeptide/oligopeptide/nickel transport system ATPase component